MSNNVYVLVKEFAQSKEGGCTTAKKGEISIPFDCKDLIPANPPTRLTQSMHLHIYVHGNFPTKSKPVGYYCLRDLRDPYALRDEVQLREPDQKNGVYCFSIPAGDLYPGEYLFVAKDRANYPACVTTAVFKVVFDS